MSVANQFQLGINEFLSSYVGVDAGASLLLLVHPDGEALANEVVTVAASRNVRSEVRWSTTPFEQLAECFQTHDAVVFLEANESTYSDELLDYLKRPNHDNHRFYRAFDFSKDLFEQSFNVPQPELQRITEGVIAAGRETAVVTVSGPSGTDLTIELDNRFGWVNSCGLSRNGQPAVCPPGEAATYSDRINGILVADGAINTNFMCPTDPRLSTCPVRVEIVNSVAVSVSSDNFVLHQILQRVFRLENGSRVGEVGFGTNVGTKHFVPFMSHINERYPSLHLGFGANNQGALVDWHCPLHLDLILDRCEIRFDRQLILANREYKVSTAPKGVLDQVRMTYADTL